VLRATTWLLLKAAACAVVNAVAWAA
jgi:hypothetical protein